MAFLETYFTVVYVALETPGRLAYDEFDNQFDPVDLWM